MKPIPEPKGPGQESVWDYPRPPRLEPFHAPIIVAHRGVTLVDAPKAFRVLETSHPPTYYIDWNDIDRSCFKPTARRSFCEWKGEAAYFDVHVGDEVFTAVAWTYPTPSAPFAALRNHVAMYAAPFERVTVDGVAVEPQPGGFYGGWVTPNITGPFKGIPGSSGW